MHPNTLCCVWDHTDSCGWFLQIQQEPPLQRQLHVEQPGTAGDRPPLRQRNPNLALRQRFIGKPAQQPAQHGPTSALVTSSMISPALAKQSNGRLQDAPSTAGQVLIGQGAARDRHSASSASMNPGAQLHPETQESWLAASHRPPPPAHPAAAAQASSSSASSSAAGPPRPALPGVSAEAVAQPRAGPAVAGQAGAPCASLGTAGHRRAAIPAGPAAATAQKHASTKHSAAGELGPASSAQHTEMRKLPAPTSGPGGAASRSCGPQGFNDSQAPHRALRGDWQTSQPRAAQHLAGSGLGHPAATPPLQAAARRGPSGPQAACVPAAAALRQGMGAQLCREAGGSHGGVRVAGAPSSAMPCSAAAAGSHAEPAALLQRSKPPEELSSHGIVMDAVVKALARPALGWHVLQLLPSLQRSQLHTCKITLSQHWTGSRF